MESNLRIAARHSINNSGNESACKIFRAADSYLSGSGIREKLDVADSLLHFVGDDLLAPQ